MGLSSHRSSDSYRRATEAEKAFRIVAEEGMDEALPARLATSHPFVSILVINFNGASFLDDCLGSLERQTYPAERREVIVVDNGSSDDSREIIRRRYPWVRLLVLSQNFGFAKGNNLGIRAARGELIALLNNDTAASPRWLEAMVAELRQDLSVGGVTSKILFKDEPEVINSAGLNLYSDGRGGDRGFRERDSGQYNEVAEVFGGCGASVLLRRAMLDDVGIFDEHFFMYYEDLDLAWRAHFRGWKFLYTPKSIVFHVHCGTSGEWSPFFLHHVERNRVLVSVKNAPLRIAFRSIAVFAARAARKWFRVLAFLDRTGTDWLQAWAYVTAGISLFHNVPAMIGQRLLNRSFRRIVPDVAFGHLIGPPPTYK